MVIEQHGSVINESYELVALDRIQPHPRNPRRGDVEALNESVDANGFYGAVVVQRSSGNILAGNHRYLAAIAKGMQSIPVIWVDVDDDRALRILLADNRTADLAGYDDQALAALLQELQAGGDKGLAGTGYDGRAVDQLLQELGIYDQDGAAEQANAAPELEAVAVTQAGDLWRCGPHRLLCGDATAQDAVSRLLAPGPAPFLMITDPPYGVEYDPKWRDGAPGQFPSMRRARGEVSNDDKADWTAAYQLFTGDVAYVWHADRHVSDLAIELESTGFVPRYLLIWKKQHFVFGRGDYHHGHEPCWYAVRKGKASHWRGDRTQSTVWEVANLNPMGGNKDERPTGHGTQKPVELMRRPILNHTEAGDAVYDPFLGSGTTMIAAEQTGRVCLGIDIDARYVDVAVRRWQEFTHQEATLDGDGRTFSAIQDSRGAAGGSGGTAEAPGVTRREVVAV